MTLGSLDSRCGENSQYGGVKTETWSVQQNMTIYCTKSYLRTIRPGEKVAVKVCVCETKLFFFFFPLNRVQALLLTESWSSHALQSITNSF